MVESSIGSANVLGLSRKRLGKLYGQYGNNIKKQVIDACELGCKLSEDYCRDHAGEMIGMGVGHQQQDNVIPTNEHSWDEPGGGYSPAPL